ncbi:Hypothetical protein D9617_8g048790 [Elsinoe fawcettii]|nr:Hypothetical protein D9617_8g048790 [Elsinoe fawcettii]
MDEALPEKNIGPTTESDIYTMIQQDLLAAVEDDNALEVDSLLHDARSIGVEFSAVITRDVIASTIYNDRVEVLTVLADWDPSVIHFDLHHGFLALYEAVRRGSLGAVCELLRLGANVSQPVAPGKQLGSFNSSLLSCAAKFRGSLMVEVLLDHGVPIPGSGALHTAAWCGQLDQIRFLVARGADMNELVERGGHPGSFWTPMHYAAKKRRTQAMDLLIQIGARTDVKDDAGHTPADILNMPSSMLPVR